MKKFSYRPLIFFFAIIFVLSTFLAYADWEAPASSAPTCTVGDPGCDAPINVSSLAQTKIGDLTVQSIMQANQGEFYNAGTALNIPNGVTKAKGGLQIQVFDEGVEGDVTNGWDQDEAGRMWMVQ